MCPDKPTLPVLICAVLIIFSPASGFWNQLVPGEDDITTILPFKGSHKLLYADDFESTTDYTLKGCTFHIALDLEFMKTNDFFLTIYEDVLSGHPIYSRNFDITEYETGPTGWFFLGKSIRYLTIDFDPDEIPFYSGHFYWIVFNMEHDDSVYAVGHNPNHWSDLLENDGGIWQPHDEVDASMELIGPVSVESATIGRIKAAFK